MATAELGCLINLEKLEGECPMAYYNKKSFSGLLIRRLQPFKSHCKVFYNGKIVVNGGTSEEESLKLAQTYCRVLQNHGYETAELKNFQIVNIVASANFDHRLRLSDAYIKLKEHLTPDAAIKFIEWVQYEPELFCAVSVRMRLATCVIFPSGKFNILGAKTKDEVDQTELDLRIILM